MTVDKVTKTLWDLMGKKLFKQLPGVHHIIVFDNTTRDIKVLYDSDKVQEMWQLVQKIELIQNTQRVRRCHMRS